MVPCYNAERYIPGFMANLSRLIEPFDEVIFYDDASTDRTCELLEQHGCNIIRGKENRGAGYARNKLAENTSCGWFHFHDIDDGLMPEYLFRTAEIARTGDFDVVLCNVDWFDAATRALSLSWTYSNREINIDPVAYTISHPIGGINGLYRKKVFEESGGFHTGIRTWEDADLHVKLAAKEARFYIIEEVLCYSLRYPASASSDQSLSWINRLRLLQDYYLSFTGQQARVETGKQAQVAAANLIMYRQFSAAKKAFELSERCGVKVPDNNSVAWGYLKNSLPRRWRIGLRLFQLSIAFRKSFRHR